MLTWEELEQAAPEIAAHGRELLEKFQFVLVGTLTKDGSPRITPVEAYIVDGHLLANMIPGSLKARDLLRDPRVYVHAPVTAKECSPEFKLAGRAEAPTGHPASFDCGGRPEPVDRRGDGASRPKWSRGFFRGPAEGMGWSRSRRWS